MQTWVIMSKFTIELSTNFVKNCDCRPTLNGIKELVMPVEIYSRYTLHLESVRDFRVFVDIHFNKEDPALKRLGGVMVMRLELAARYAPTRCCKCYHYGVVGVNNLVESRKRLDL